MTRAIGLSWRATESLKWKMIRGEQVSGFRKNLWNSLKNRAFRREYVAENVRTGLAYQIKAMRNARRMSQIDLAKATGKSQGNIARLENPDYGNFSLKTLLELANAFDVWLSVEFISFSRGLARTEDRTTSVLNAIPFVDDWEGRENSVGTSANSSIVIAPPKNISSLRRMFVGYQTDELGPFGTGSDDMNYFRVDEDKPTVEKTVQRKSSQMLYSF